MKKGNIVFIFLFLIFCFKQLSAQNKPGHRLETIPFLFNGYQVLIPVNIDDKEDTLHFLFDTGCEVNILSSEAAQRLQLEDKGESGISGWRKEMTMVPQAHARSLQIGNITLPYPEFYIQNLGNVTLNGISVDGVIGYSLLQRYIIKLDFQQKEMTFFRAGSFRYPPGGELLKVGMNYKTPAISASIFTGNGQMFTSTYHVITGGNFGLLLNDEYVQKYKLNASLQTTGSVTRQDLLLPVTYTQCQVPVLQIGKNKLTHIPALYSSKVNDDAPGKEIAGAIGAEVWKQFTMILNLPGKELYLKWENGNSPIKN